MRDATPASSTIDVLLVGGGLASSLIALAVRRKRPELKVVMLERELVPPPAPTWSLFASDVSSETWRQLEQGFERSWSGYEVAFPGHARRLATPYGTLTAPRLAALVSKALGPDLQRGRHVKHVGPHEVICEDGTSVRASVVIDSRGGRPSGRLQLAYQKFLGLELRLRRPHGLLRPMVMDATVRQEDGYRFLYVLPLDETRLLVEDTRYSDGPALDVACLQAAVLRYARGRGWLVGEILRSESGVLPVVLGGDPAAYLAQGEPSVPQAGVRGLFFHPTTGYSLPDAAAIAERVACARLSSSAELAQELTDEALRLWRARRFYRALNRMLFLAAQPQERYRVLERFYRLPEPLIERFYAGRSTFADKARILAGRPPVPIGRALAALPGRVAHA